MVSCGQHEHTGMAIWIYSVAYAWLLPACSTKTWLRITGVANTET